MGKHLYPNDDILASFHCMTGKKDDKEEEYPQYEENPGDNIISINFEKVKGAAKERLVELIERTKKSEFSKTEDTNNCRVCPYINVCNYTKPKDIKLDLIKKITKASDDFSLTDSQRKAVIFEKGIARINAGAGSGKTTTIALRVANLILSGYKPEDILLITFTNKGAAEMKEKTAYWLKKEGVEINKDRLNITTFNSWGNEIIMENYKELGFTAPPVLIEKVQKYDMIFELLKKYPKLKGFDYKNPVMDYRYSRGVVTKLSNIFDYIKAYHATEDMLTGKVVETEIAKIFAMYDEYNKMLKEKNMIEYQDQLNLILDLTENNSPIMNKYNYKHIIIDEFQDTDSVQLDLIIFLTNQSNFESLMVVGDDCQCQPTGTKISTPEGKTTNIEDLKIEDKTLSCSISEGYYPKSPKGTKKIKNISTHRVNILISIGTEKGKISKYTLNHRCLARIHYEGNEDKSVVYLMENEKGYFKIGQTKLFVNNFRDFGVRYRMNTEGGINAWILKVCDSFKEARLIEQTCAYKYGIPQITWTPNSNLYNNIDLINLRKKIIKCLESFGRNIDYPIFEKNKNTHFSKKHIAEIRACNLMPKIMDVVVPKLKNNRWENSYEKLISVDTIYDPNGFIVYGLDIEDYHTYIADGILTHNSIFGFRNTSQENILNFHLMFNEVKDIKIIENFRSTPEIVDLANALNDLNKHKIDKKLISGAKHGDKPVLISFSSIAKEYTFIAKEIKRLLQTYEPEDIAIIARKKSELFEMEEFLTKEDIPYTIDVPEPLIKDTNIKIIKSLISFLDNPEITQGIFEYLFVATDGFKGISKDKIKNIIDMEKQEYTKILKEIDEEKTDEFKLNLLYKMIHLLKDESLSKFISEIKEKKYNFNELKGYISKFIEYEDGKTIEKIEKRYKAVTLTTAHTSKGKEFPVVFNILDGYKSDRTLKAIEEERRTLYVALTRAKEKLYITYKTRQINKYSKFNGKSYEEFDIELKNTGKCDLIFD